MRTQLREMRPNDVPAVRHRLREQNYRDGTSYSLPRIFDDQGLRLASIPLAMVAVDVNTGLIEQGHVWQRTVEQMTFGISPEATVCSMRASAAIFWMLRERGYTDQHILVPVERVKDLAGGLDQMLGMIDTGETLRHFYRLLDPSDNEDLREWYRKQGR